MLIGGFQKLTLVDFPEKVACIVFVRGCLFRCRYCHNPDLIFHKKNSAYVDEKEIFKYLENKKDFLDGVVITGGEPTIQNDLLEFIRKIKSLGLFVKLDTNGVRPNVVRALVSEGLVDYIAMDLKHVWSKYADITQAPNALDNTPPRETFLFIQSCGVEHEFRTTMLPGVHKEEDFFIMAGYLKKGEVYYLQDINYQTTFEKNLETKKKFDLTRIVRELQTCFPHLMIKAR